jgi:DNA-cytosine methyltransferase
MSPTYETKRTLRVVDLFCGAGGLACGFDFNDGGLGYKTVLGIDIEPSAIRIFNANFLPSLADAPFGIGRLADMTWFAHPVEVRLFYLVHLAHTGASPDLLNSLAALGLYEFCNQLRACDERFSCESRNLADSASFKTAVDAIPGHALALALPKAFLQRLGVQSLSDPQPDVRHLPWTAEYLAFKRFDVSTKDSAQPDPDLLQSSLALWDTRTNEIHEASAKIGKGQNKNNSAHLGCIASFLVSGAGAALRDIWINWRATRETIRAKFCLRISDELNRLYFDTYKADIVLGGPPCKGFSRIGRPVIQSLRDQGVHAWSHKEFGDERNALMCQYVLFLRALQPDVFLFENVSNFQSALKTPSGVLDAPTMLTELIDDLSDDDLHYNVHHSLVNARRFAVPQDRRRFIMFGVNARKASLAVAREFFSFPPSGKDVPLQTAMLGLSEPEIFSPSSGIKTDYRSPVYHFYDERLPQEVRTYLAWIQQRDPTTGSIPKFTTAHIYRQSREDDLAFIGFVAPGIRWMDLKVDKSDTLAELQTLFADLLGADGIENLKSRVRNAAEKIDSSLMLRLLLEHTKIRFGLSEQHLLLDGYLKNGGSTHGDWLERLSATKPSRTIVAHIGKDTYAYWHPTEPRAISIREAARIQSFPDFFRLDGCGVVDTYAAIGNAVAPLMANAFAKRIMLLNQKYDLFSNDERRFVERPQRTARQLNLSV